MKFTKLMYFSLLAAFTLSLLTVTQQLFCQIPSFNKIQYLNPRDSTNIVQLINNGVKLSKGSVIAWFPKDSLPKNRMERIIDTLNIGINGAEKFINAPHSWQAQQKGDKYTFYFRTDTFISHASGAGFVSISFWRIKEGKAPWLHEAIHEMLNSKAAASITDEEWDAHEPDVWLIEGLPSYIAIQVSQQNNLPIFDPLTNRNLRDIDSSCKESLRNERSEYILSFIGRNADMPELYGKDRKLYAPAFYNCSCSFVKYMVEQVGIEPLLKSISKRPREHEELQKLKTPSLEVMKKAWIRKLHNE